MGTRRIRFLCGLAISLGLLTVAPPAVSAAGSYSLDGGIPTSCAKPYVTWNSATFTPSGVTGYVKVELMYCPANQVVWTRAYNYTNHNPAWLATGIERVSSDTAHNRSEDFVKGTCDTMCRDNLAYGQYGYGRQLWIPRNFTGGLAGHFTATVYYCYSVTSNCSNHAIPLYASASAVGPKIANLAYSQLKTKVASCGDFAYWVWKNADPGVNVSTLANTPASFAKYNPFYPPHVGDAVIFSSYNSDTHTSLSGAHVGIVYRLNSNGIVDAVAGNDDGQGTVRMRSFQAAIGSYAGTIGGPSQTLTVQGYSLPMLYTTP